MAGTHAAAISGDDLKGKSLRVGLLAIAVTALALVPVSGAVAAPLNPANQLVGTADCGGDGSFTFLVTENNGRGGGWNPAFITGG